MNITNFIYKKNSQIKLKKLKKKDFTEILITKYYSLKKYFVLFFSSINAFYILLYL